MSEPNWEEILAPTIRNQVSHIVNEFRKDGAAAEVGEVSDNGSGGIDIGVVTSGDGVAFMYAEGQILVRENYLERVQEILEEPKPTVREILNEPKGYAPVEPLIEGTVVLYLSSPSDRPKLTALEALDRIDRVLGPGYATPNHVLTVAGDVGPCPATEPEVVYDGIEPYPSVFPVRQPHLVL